MGHEYVELKNTAAAVDAYRRRSTSTRKTIAHGMSSTRRTRHRGACTPARSDAPHPPSQVRARADVRDPADALLRAFLLPEGDRAAAVRFADVVRDGRVLQGAAANEGGDPVLPGSGSPRRSTWPLDVTPHTNAPPLPHSVRRRTRIAKASRFRSSRGSSRRRGHAACGSLLPAHPRAPRRRARRRRPPEVQEALSFLANFCKERGELREASQYCTRLVDSGSQFKEEAKAMLREIHARTTSG